MTDKPGPETYPEAYYAGAYWNSRKESPEECARRAAAFFNLLAPCDPFLARWYKPPKSRGEARKHPLMPPDTAVLTEMFRSGVNREKGGPVFEDLGFRMSTDNGGPTGDCAVLRIKCGDYSGANPNNAVLTLPSQGPNAERVLSAPVLTNVVRSMALAWEPDWAVATSADYRDLLSEKGRAGTFAGWVMYLSRLRSAVPPLPAPVRIEPLEGRGMLVILTPERLTASNPAHVELGRRVHETLDRAGLMQPVIP